MTDILMCTAMPPLVIDGIASRFTLHKLWEQHDPHAYLAEVGPCIRGLAGTLTDPVGGDLLAKLPKLEIIASFGVGYDKIDTEETTTRGIVVTNTPGVLDDEVADLTIGLLIGTIRQLPQADRFLRDGRWREGTFPLSPSLRGRRIGILGLGNIGQAIAQRLAGFDVSIAYHTRRPRSDVAYAYHSSAVALAEASDVLIAIVPGGADTKALVNAEVLKALGPNGIFINVARGSVVDQPALIEALATGTILAAGLDVFADEPNVPQALIDLPNAVLLPHVGSASEKTRADMGQLVVDNIVSWFDTGRPITPVPESAALLA